MLISQATILEWPQIEGLRNAHKAKFPPFPWDIDRPSHSDWYVCRSAQKVLGCYAYDDQPNGIRWLTNFYIQHDLPKMQRVKVAIMMRDHATEDSIRDKIPVVFSVRAENRSHLRFVSKRTKAKPLSMIFFNPCEASDE